MGPSMDREFANLFGFEHHPRWRRELIGVSLKAIAAKRVAAACSIAESHS